MNNKFQEQLQLIRESIFKGASEKEVVVRKEQYNVVRFKEWFDEGLKSRKLKKNVDGSYDYDGGVYLSDWNLKEIPIQFNKVTGDFDCTDNQLTSLEGCPKEVGGHFWCDDNQLTSLEGCPIKVGEGFDCNDNQLTSLKGCPKEVGGYFDCTDNQLTSLEGCPQKVGGYFYCFDNKKKFTTKEVRALCNVEGSIYV